MERESGDWLPTRSVFMTRDAAANCADDLRDKARHSVRNVRVEADFDEYQKLRLDRVK